MLANEWARITGWQSRLLLYKGRRGCCIFLTQYSCGSNEKVSQRSEIWLKSFLVGLHLERCSSRVWNPRISIFKISLVYLRPGRLLSIPGETAFGGKTNSGKRIQRSGRLWKEGKRENTTETHGTFPKAQRLWCFWAIWNESKYQKSFVCLRKMCLMVWKRTFNGNVDLSMSAT